MKNGIGLLLLGGSLTLFAALPSTPGWYEIPNTKIDDVCAYTHGFTDIGGAEGCSGITADWSGGFFESKRNRLIVWGGGHNGYYGNELYSLNLNGLTLTRITDPGAAVHSCSVASASCVCGYQGCGCSETVANGTQPNGRHTYDGMIYMPNVDKMYTLGGSLSCSIGYESNWTWTFDFANLQWEHVTPSDSNPHAKYGDVCDYDPNTGKVFFNDLAYLYTYDPIVNAYQRLAGSYKYGIDYHMTSVIDPKRKKFVMLGGNQAWIFDISGTSYACQALTTTGGSAIINSGYPGLAYDPVRDKIVAWNGGDVVYSLNLDTKAWSSVTFTGGPGNAISAGTYKRWGYSAVNDAFVLVNRTNQNAFAFRFSGSTGGEEGRGQMAEGKGQIELSPNPVSGRAVIVGVFSAAGGPVQIFDLRGRLVSRLSNGVWDASRVPNGLYVVRARIAGQIFSTRILVQK